MTFLGEITSQLREQKFILRYMVLPQVYQSMYRVDQVQGMIFIRWRGRFGGVCMTSPLDVLIIQVQPAVSGLKEREPMKITYRKQVSIKPIGCTPNAR